MHDLNIDEEVQDDERDSSCLIFLVRFCIKAKMNTP